MKMKRMGKRVLSAVLCLVMLFTTFCIFDIGSLMSSAASSSADVLFYTPETIYLKPQMWSFRDTTTSTFQYYVQNNVVDGSNLKPTPEVIKGSSDRLTGMTTGYVYFQCNTASSIGGISATIEGGSGSVSYSAGLTKINNYYRATINNGSSVTLPASSSGCYIKWTLTYKDSADGKEKQAISYTYVYKPNVTPYGSLARARNKDGFNSDWKCNTAVLSWVSGVHTIASNSADYYARIQATTTNENPSLAGFLTDSAMGVKTSYGKTDGNADHKAYSFANDMYMAFASTNLDSNYVLYNDESDRSPTDWFTQNTADSCYPIPTFNYYNREDNDTYITSMASSLAIGTLYVDISRYDNLNEIPNLGAGFIVTDLPGTYNKHVAWYVADVSNTAEFRNSNGSWNDTKTDNIYNLWYTNCGTILASSVNNGAAPPDYKTTTGDNYVASARYAGAWSSDLTKNTSFYFRGIANAEQRNEDEWTAASATVRLDTVKIDKSNLRTAVNNATKKFAYYGFYMDGSNLKSYSGAITKDQTILNDYLNAYTAAYKALVTLDANCDITTLLNNLSEAEAKLTAISYSSSAFVAPEVIYLTPANSTAGQNFQYYVNNNVSLNNGQVSVTTSAAKGTSGNIYFYYPDAKDGSVSLSYTYAGSVTVSSLTKGSNGLYTATVTTGKSNSYTSSNINWTLSYVDNTDGLTKSLFATTYVYAPYIYAAAAAGSAHDVINAGISRAGVTSMIYGVHKMNSTGNAIYAGGSVGTDCDNKTGYINPIPLVTSNYTPALFCNGSAPTFYAESSDAQKQGFAYYYRGGSEGGCNVSGGIAQLYVDSSRYSTVAALGSIPNFTLRLDFNGHYHEDKKMAAAAGQYWGEYIITNGSAGAANTKIETVNYCTAQEQYETTHTVAATISSSTSISSVGSIINHTKALALAKNNVSTKGKERYANAYSACDISSVDKSKLREEIYASTAAMAGFAMNGTYESMGSNFGYNATRLTRFVNAYKNAYAALTKLDQGYTAAQIESLRAELANARADLPNATVSIDFNANGDTLYYQRKDANGNSVFTGIEPAVTAYNTTIGSKLGTAAALPEPIRAGYKFLGWYTSTAGTVEEVKAAEPVTMFMPSDVGKLEQVNAYTVIYQDAITIYARWEKADEQLMLDNIFNFDVFAQTWLADSATKAKSVMEYYLSNAGTATVDWLDRTVSLTSSGRDCHTSTSGLYKMAVTAGKTYSLIFDYDASASVGIAPYVFFSDGTHAGCAADVSAGTGTLAFSFTVPSGCTEISIRLGFRDGIGATVDFSNISVAERYQYYDEYDENTSDKTPDSEKVIKRKDVPFDVHWLTPNTITSTGDINKGDKGDIDASNKTVTNPAFAVSQSDDARIVDLRDIDTITTATMTLPSVTSTQPLLSFVGWDKATVTATGIMASPDSANTLWALQADYTELSEQRAAAQLYAEIYDTYTHKADHNYYTAESYAVFKAAYDAANAATYDLNAEYQPYIDKLATDLEAAIAGLKINTVCLNELTEVIEAAQAKIDADNEFYSEHTADSNNYRMYTAESMAALKAAKAEAEAKVAENPKNDYDVTSKEVDGVTTYEIIYPQQNGVDSITKKLNAAIAGLQYARADYRAVEAEINAAQEYIDLWNNYNHKEHHDYYDATLYNELLNIIGNYNKDITTEDQTQIAVIAQEIKDAYTALKPVKACYDELYELWTWAEGIEIDPKGSEFDFETARDEAKAILDTRNTANYYTTKAEDQKVIDDAKIKLENEIAIMTKDLKPEDIVEMTDAYAYGMSLMEEHYTRASWKVFADALKDLNDLITKFNEGRFIASPTRIHNEAQKIYTAASNLKYEYIDPDAPNDQEYGDELPEVTVKYDGATVSYQTRDYIPYRICTVVAPRTDANGNAFSWWVDQYGTVVSTYRSYSFYACAAVTLTPVYGQSQEDVESHYAAMRVVGVRNNNNITNKGIYSILVERSMSRYLDSNPMVQHGVIYSYYKDKIDSVATANYPTAGSNPRELDDDVLVAMASKTATSRNGLLEVQVKLEVGKTIYMRPYVSTLDGNFYYFDVAEYTATAPITTSSVESEAITVMNVEEFTLEQVETESEIGVEDPTVVEPSTDTPTDGDSTDTNVEIPTVSWFDMLLAWFGKFITFIKSAFASIL